jgi:predicted nucleotidyltransferase
MVLHDRSECRARQILESYVNSITNEFSEYICTILLVGSLTNGSYIEGPGRDIDQITIISDETPETVRLSLYKRINEIQSSFNNDIPIAKSIYKYSEMQRPFKTDIKPCIEEKYLLEVTTELLRIHESGIVLCGKNIISQLPFPTRDEVAFLDKLGNKWSDEVSKLIPPPNIQGELPIRIIVQIILTNAFRHYFYFTGKSCSNKHLIAERIKSEIKNYRFQDLLDLATEIKMNPDKDLSCEKIKQLRNTFLEFQYWIKNYPVDAVPLKL